MKREIPLLVCGSKPTSATFAENLTGAAPDQATTLRCWRDGERLWVEFECNDRHPWATLTERDGPLWTEEVVEVFIDPVGDGQSYFEFEINPLGTVCDLVLRRIASGWRKEFAWNCEGLESSVARTAEGWTARLGIPWLSLVDAVPAIGSEWRVNFHRIDRPAGAQGPRELSSWSPTFAETFHVAARFGRLRIAD